ncbi:16S rRNA (adenine(1518)-N(6)/adenine(1519)-N(6))-dimethyltransferase RsmA [Inquilinus sp. CA228]|uniref:16S rRNA (adenine(1518)-N(6)/adenine(1519)-N(6))- dimethyltransferase RsmA n=1 Tax=Inquilinus sp. CA228 TaxID=3455609 RepID=UPI003F8D1A13
MTLSGDALRDAIAALPPLRDVIARHGLAAKKSLGQNFLLDLNVTARIVREAGDLAGVHVVEIGPGPGGLTRALLASAADSVTVVERDRRFRPALEELAAIAGDRLRVVEADALKTDIPALVPAPRAVIANLPYNVATPLLIGWLRRIDEFRSLTLMFQKEVADRLVANPRSHAYGRLSVIAQWRAEVDPLLTLPARAFTPPPKVDSTVVRFRPRADREVVPFAAMETVTAAAFGQRRKMLRASLRSLGDAEALLAEAGLTPTARAEEIDIAGFVRLARAVAARQEKS